MSTRRPRKALVTAAWLGVGAVVLAGCKLPTFGTFTPVTRQEHGSYQLYQGLTIAAMLVGAFVWALIFWCVIRYRRRPHHGDEIPRQTRYNYPWEVAYTITPLVMVAIIFIFTVISENSADAVPKNPDLTVDVSAFQWGWRFDYPLPDGHQIAVIPQQAPTPSSAAAASTGERSSNALAITYPTMVLPVGRVAQINLISEDVVHGFYIPEFEFSRYAQPGIINRFDFTPTRTGTFSGRCTQFCGLYHTQMQFYVKVVSQADYRAWVNSQSQPGQQPAPTPSPNQGPPA